jgi:autotransporter translocation and assembly factor TamB
MAAVPDRFGWLVGKTELAVTVTGTVAKPEVAGSMVIEDCTYAGDRIERVSAVGRFSWPHLHLDSGTIHGDGTDISLSGDVDFSSMKFTAARCDATLANLSLINRWLPPAFAVGGHGRIAIGFDGRPWPLEDLFASAGTLTLDCEDLIVGAQRVGKTLTSARLQDGLLRVDRIGFDGGTGALDAAGSIAYQNSDWSLMLERMQFDVDEVSATIRTPLRARFGAQEWSLSQLRMELGGGQVEADLRCTDRLDGAVTITDVQLQGLGKRYAPGLDLSGLLTGSLVCSGNADAPFAELALSARELSVSGRRGTLAVEVTQSQDGLRISRLNIDAGDTLTVDANGLWPAALGIHGLRAVAIHPADMHCSGSADLAQLIPGLPGSPNGSVLIDMKIDQDGRLHGEGDISVDGLALKQAPDATADYPPTRLILKFATTADGLHATLTGDNVLRTFLRGELTTPASVRLGDDLSTAMTQPLRGSIAMENYSLSPLSAMIPGLVRLAGTADVDLRCAGTIDSPETSGSLRLRDFSCKMRNDIPAIEDGTATIAWSGHVATIERLDARMGYAPVVVSGTCDLADFAHPRFDLSAHGDNVLLISTQTLRVRGDVAELSLKGPIEAMLVAGKITITDALYSKPIELLSASTPSVDKKMQLFSFRHGPRARMSFDLAISAADTIRIDNNLLHGKFSANMTLAGTGAVPEPRGVFYGRDARVTLPFSTLYIDSAEIRFPPDNPFDPTVNISGKATVKKYTLRITVTGPASDALVDISSDLSPTDAQILLATGVTPEERGRGNIERTSIGVVGTYVAKELVRWASGPSDPDKKDSFSDRFDIDIKHNDTGQDTFETSYRLTGQERLERGRGWYLRAERDRYEEYNFGLLFRFKFRGTDD